MVFGVILFSIVNLAMMGVNHALEEIKICVPVVILVNFCLTVSAIILETVQMDIIKIISQMTALVVTKNAKHVMENLILIAFLVVSLGI